jgi:hypothetical protein
MVPDVAYLAAVAVIALSSDLESETVPRCGAGSTAGKHLGQMLRVSPPVLSRLRNALASRALAG